MQQQQASRPWVERYRPKSLKEVSHQSEVVATLENATATGRLPHLLFYGPPGSGKTSVALAFCRQLWHPSQWKRRVLELNASDERGISVVRDKIKHFAGLSVGTGVTTSSGGSKTRTSAASFFQKPSAKTSSASAMDVDEERKNDDDKKKDEGEQSQKKYPNPPFKVIILDEADTITPDAQAALRRIIEAHSKITRFILICNYVTRIIEPLASRCAKFRFQALPPDSMKERLNSIASAEECSPDVCNVIDTILQNADGDMRRAVTTLQSVHSLTDGGCDINSDTISEIAGLPPLTVVNKFWTSVSSSATSFDVMQRAVEEVCSDGFSAQILLSSLLDKVIQDAVLDEASKAHVSIRIAEAEKNMIDGADEYLQLMTVCSLLHQCYSNCQNKMEQ